MPNRSRIALGTTICERDDSRDITRRAFFIGVGSRDTIASYLLPDAGGIGDAVSDRFANARHPAVPAHLPPSVAVIDDACNR
jgi:hypothetical protein